MGSTLDPGSLRGGGDDDDAHELWSHPDPKSTPMWHFLEAVNTKHDLQLEGYEDLYQWSIDDVSSFWEEVWHFVGIVASRPFDQVLPRDAPMFPRPDFFSSARLNFAENLLYPATPSPIDPSSIAIITATEPSTGSGAGQSNDHLQKHTTWAELRELVRRCTSALRAAGLAPGDIVAGYVSNHLEALVAMLAASSIGAVWTGISPDTGVSAVLDRLGQIGPKVLFADNGTVYNGKEWSSGAKTLEIVKQLLGGSNSASAGGAKPPGHLETVVVINNIASADLGIADIEALGGGGGGGGGGGAGGGALHAVLWDAFLEPATHDERPLVFEQLPPSHPLYILYSSGTTGLPKAIIHTALGTLIQHKKEHVLHCSLGPSSRMLYYTTTSWMMWHWSVSALAAGSSLVLYSGSPFRPHGNLSLPRLLSDLRVTHFGTSAAYLTSLEANAVRPALDPALDLSALQAVYSTASPLPPSTFRFVYSAFPPAVNLASITGGTDIISLFGAPCPLLPVRAGQIQCAGLGMAIRAVDSLTGEPLQDPSLPGDLVCVRPFPCQPLTFFGPSGDARYRAAYFERFPSGASQFTSKTNNGNHSSSSDSKPITTTTTTTTPGPIWHHGDFVRIPNPRTGSLIMLGRSDGVLKPAGVRFGSAEIYNILIRFFPADVDDAVCVGRRRPQDSDETVCLFLLMLPGRPCSEDLKAAIRNKIKTELSPRHVPAVIDVCGNGIPKTGNGKKIEVAVKQILSGMDIVTNASVANPEALDWFKEWAKTH